MCTNNIALSSAKPVCLPADNARVFIFTRYVCTAVWASHCPATKGNHNENYQKISSKPTNMTPSKPVSVATRTRFAIFGIHSVQAREIARPKSILKVPTQSKSYTLLQASKGSTKKLGQVPFSFSAANEARPQNNSSKRNHKILHKHGECSQRVQSLNSQPVYKIHK